MAYFELMGDATLINKSMYFCRRSTRWKFFAPPHHSGVTRGLSQGGQAWLRGPLTVTQVWERS